MGLFGPSRKEIEEKWGKGEESIRRIAETILPRLKKEGRISILELSKTLGFASPDPRAMMLTKAYVDFMATRGYLEDAHRDENMLVLPKAPSTEQVVIKETVKEVVKMPCRYCGTLVPVESQKCPECGARLR